MQIFRCRLFPQLQFNWHLWTGSSFSVILRSAHCATDTLLPLKFSTRFVYMYDDDNHEITCPHFLLKQSISCNGQFSFFMMGHKAHRLDGPSQSERGDDGRRWVQRHRRHRTDGPAMERTSEWRVWEHVATRQAARWHGFMHCLSQPQVGI